MAIVKLNFPPGITNFADSYGTNYTPDANGQVTVNTNTLVSLSDFLTAGFSVPPDVSNAVRPTTGLYPGMPAFDPTLNSGVGLPIWRNASNSAWINAAGTVV